MYTLPTLCRRRHQRLVRTFLGNGLPAEPEKRAPPPSSSATLCSNERVYRVEGNSQGRFRFEKVKQGEYDLVAVARSFDPELISHLRVVGDESIGPITAIVHGGPRSTPCYVSTEGRNLLRDFDVDYEPADPSRTAAVVQIETQRYVHVHHRELDMTTRPLAHAQIRLFRAGEASPVLSTTSSKHGTFTLHPQPGIYELLMTRQGYYDVRIPSFLVPRENVTSIELRAATEGSIVIDR